MDALGWLLRAFGGIAEGEPVSGEARFDVGHLAVVGNQLFAVVDELQRVGLHPADADHPGAALTLGKLRPQ